jgi:hypothetical protein
VLDTIAKQLGPGFMVPALAVLILGWLAKLLTDLHTGSRQSRRDFLELWRTLDKRDDIALEVVTRHLFGEYLPADVVRTVTGLTFPSRRLQRLSMVWPHLEYDATTQQITLVNRKLRARAYRRWAVGGYLTGYFILAMLGAYGLQIATKMSPSTVLTWMVVVAGAGALIVAFGSLARSDTIRSLGAWGLALVDEVNAHLLSQHARELVPPHGTHGPLKFRVATAPAGGVQGERATD